MLWAFNSNKIKRYRNSKEKLSCLWPRFHYWLPNPKLVFDVSFIDKPRTGRSSDLDQDDLRELVEYIPHKSTRELALELNTSQSIICHHRKKICKVNKMGVWVHHIHSERNKEERIFITTNLLRQNNYPSLKNYYKGLKVCLLEQCSTQNVMGWQGWIFTAEPKKWSWGRLKISSTKFDYKSHIWKTKLCWLWSPRYYSF